MFGGRTENMPTILGIPWKPEQANRDWIKKQIFERILCEKQKKLAP